jgi:hypothetical protein
MTEFPRTELTVTRESYLEIQFNPHPRGATEFELNCLAVGETPKDHKSKTCVHVYLDLLQQDRHTHAERGQTIERAFESEAQTYHL